MLISLYYFPQFFVNCKKEHYFFVCLGANEALDTLHILGLLRDIMSTFPQNSIKSTCETVLRVMTVSNVVKCFKTWS